MTPPAAAVPGLRPVKILKVRPYRPKYAPEDVGFSDFICIFAMPDEGLFDFIATRMRISTILATWLCTVMAAPSAAATTTWQHLYEQWHKLPGSQLVRMGSDYTMRQNSADSALVCYTIVANRRMSRNLDKDELHLAVRAMNNIGYIYAFRFYDYQKAYSYLVEALDLAKANGFRDNLPYIYLNIGVLYLLNSEMHNQTNYTDEILDYLKKAYYAALEVGDFAAATLAYNNMAGQAIKHGNTARITDETNLMCRTHIPAKCGIGRYTIATARAMQAFGRHDYEQSLRLFQSLPQLVPAGDDQKLRYYIAARYNEAIVLCCMRRYAAATATLNGVAELAEQSGERDVQAEIYEMLHRMHAKVGNRQLADKYYVMYLKEKDTILSECNMEQIETMKFSNSLKKIDDQMRDVAERHRMQNIILWAVIAITAISTLCLVVVLRNNRRLQRYIKVLYRKNMELLESGAKDKKKPAYVLNEDTKEELVSQIASVMDNTELVCSPEFSLTQLAQMVNSNYKYVSLTINEKYGKSFKALLNECRIHEACRRMNDTSNYGHLTIEAISMSVGFKSRANFAVMFKRITGLSPSEFQKAAHAQTTEKES